MEPEGCGLPRVAGAGEGVECSPSRENVAEAILSVGSNRGVGCDMVPVEVLKCFFASECKDFGAAVRQHLSPDTASARVDGAVWRSRFQSQKDQRRKGALAWSPVLEEAALPTQMVPTEHRIRRGPCGVERQPEASQHEPCLSTSLRPFTACRVNKHLAFVVQRRASRSAWRSRWCLHRCWCRVSWRETPLSPGAVSALTSKHWCGMRTETHG